MRLIAANIRWIMLVSGALTCTMVFAAIAPEAALLSMFGETLTGPLAAIVVRNWGVLVTLVGVMLIWGAFSPAVRTFAVAIAGASKLAFVALVLAEGRRFLGQQVGVAVAIDLVWVVLFGLYLLGPRPAAVASR
jgi:hypothetical protein